MPLSTEVSPEISDAPQPKRVSVVIVSLNRANTLRESLEALGEKHQVVVVDNGSQDGSASVGDGFPAVRVMRLPKNFGLTKALNIGLRAAESEYLLCLHDDTVISAEGVTQLADYLDANPGVGAVSPLLTSREGTPVPQVQALPTPAQAQPAMKPANGSGEIMAECVSGAAIMFRAFFLRAVRQIDDRYGDYGSNIEICAQMKRAAKKIVVLKNVTAVHDATASSVAKDVLEGDRVAGTAVFLGKHHGLMGGMMYRLKAGLGGLVRLQFSVVGAAFADAKIDGTTS